ncbi:MAG: 16S rRNA (guanine(966)-N(2))-methyltransferase RsmD [bacterium]
MRIISGKYKGRIIKMPQGIRPTQDKVRKALFDILGDIQGLSFLELFSGSGAVGLDALSRGARQVVFVENNPDCFKTLKNNFTYLLPTTYYLLPLDAAKAIDKLSKDREKFDIIFLDPPYHKDMSKKILQMLGAYDILPPNGFVVVQHFKKEQLPKESGKLSLIKESRYGDTYLSFYKKVASRE